MNVRHRFVVTRLSALLFALCAVTSAHSSPTYPRPHRVGTAHAPNCYCPAPTALVRLQEEDDKPTQKVIGKPITRAQAVR